MTPHPTIAAWIAAIEHGDAAPLRDLLAADVLLHSPLTDAFVFRGAAQVWPVFDAALELISDVRVHTVTSNDDAHAIFLHGVVAGTPVEEAQLHRLDADGRIVEITLMGRPLPALLEVMKGIGPRLARAGVMSPLAGRAGAGVVPIAAVMGLIERRLMPRLPPHDPAPRRRD